MHNLPFASYWNKYVFLSLKFFRKKAGLSFITAFNIYASPIYFVVLFLVIGLFSCSPAKNTTYFQNIQKDTTLRNLVSKDFEPKIQKGDLLNITVASLSPDIPLYNAPQNAQGAISGYLVDGNGYIQFVKLDSIHADGMTRTELKNKLRNDLVPYLKDAVVSVGFLNRHITMLGGVQPQVIPMANDNMTILDALAVSGDIIEKGRTDNILVIREKGDSARQFKRLRLTDNSIFYSPYFFLQPNDIVYVEPKKIKPPVSTAQLISIVASGVSLIVLLLNTVKL